MLFNSIDFAIFLPLVFALYWGIKDKLKLQNILLLLASYIFYGWWDWKFLFLIAFSTLVDYSIGFVFSTEWTKEKWKKRFLLGISIGVNLGLLGFFKYYNFFVENFVEAFTLLGTRLDIHTLEIILPVGISFYTFQTMSYTIDIYRGELTPTRDFIAFSAFVSFFPQLVAGPIERASNLLPQFYQKRYFDEQQASNGMRQILWGLFKKIVIADNCASFVNQIFENPSAFSGGMLILGAVFFALQIYGDFSGYSDIAIGTSRLFGFNLMQNFAFPYFSRDVAEFWRRWHISLTTWFRDYLYIPLGGSRGGKTKVLRNTFIIFLVSGFWHGANWTFIAWGALNALYFIPLLLRKKNRRYLDVVAQDRIFPNGRELLSMFWTFSLITLAWIFFRAASITDGFNYIREIFTGSFFGIEKELKKELMWLLSVLIPFILMEWWGRRDQFAIEHTLQRSAKAIRWSIYILLILTIFLFSGEEHTFIYFQF